jgi:release factor glutamine methyltransferase
LDLLRWTTQHFAKRGLETPRLDAECLLAFALGCDRLRLYIDFDQAVGTAQRAHFREFVRRRAEERVPVAHLTGHREFWSLDLLVTPDVLTPRPETETLMAVALELAPEAEAELRVLDLGTGSGALALALARERPKARFTASDISEAALQMACRNAERVGVAERVHLVGGSLFEPVAGERFDLVVSNPPYLAEREASQLAPELRHEPRDALFAGPDGTAVLEPLARRVGEFLLPGGAVAIEVDPRQAQAVAGWLGDGGLVQVTVHRDLAHRARVVAARRSEGE